MNAVPVEPSVDIRMLANVNRQLFVAHVEQGFTPQEALMIIGALLAAQINKGEA